MLRKAKVQGQVLRPNITQNDLQLYFCVKNWQLYIFSRGRYCWSPDLVTSLKKLSSISLVQRAPGCKSGKGRRISFCAPNPKSTNEQWFIKRFTDKGNIFFEKSTCIFGKSWKSMNFLRSLASAAVDKPKKYIFVMLLDSERTQKGPFSLVFWLNFIFFLNLPTWKENPVWLCGDPLATRPAVTL